MHERDDTQLGYVVDARVLTVYGRDCLMRAKTRANTRFVKWSRCFVRSGVIGMLCTSIRDCTLIDSAISNLEGTMAKRKKAVAKKAAKKTKRAKKRK